MDFKEKANEVQEKLKEQLGNIDTEKLKEQAKGVADKAVDFAKEQVEKIDTDKLKEQAKNIADKALDASKDAADKAKEFIDEKLSTEAEAPAEDNGPVEEVKAEPVDENK